jgi:hypothetical protein
VDEVVNHIQKTWKAMEPDVPLNYSFVDETVAAQYGKRTKDAGHILWILCAFITHCLLWVYSGLTTFRCRTQSKRDRHQESSGCKCAGIVGFIVIRFYKTCIDINCNSNTGSMVLHE